MSLSITTPMGGYSGNALRFGLIDIRPIEISETVKRFGLKFRRTIKGYETLSPSKSYEELVKFKNQTVFNTIKIPERFEAEKLAEMFSQNSIAMFNKDKEMKEAIDQLKKSSNKDKPLLSFIQFFRDRLEEKRDHYLEIESNRFLRSNFPLSFFNKFVVYDNTFYNSLEIMERIVRIHESQAFVARNILARQKIIKDMQKKLVPIIDVLDRCDLAHSCLKHYITICNSDSYKEVKNPRYLDLKKIDISEYEELFNDYVIKLRETRNFLLHYNPEYLHTELEHNEFTKNMLANLVVLPSNFLRF